MKECTRRICDVKGCQYPPNCEKPVDEYPAKQGVATFEEPFRISGRGISFRGKDFLELKGQLNWTSMNAIVGSFNKAFQLGFEDGQSVLSKMLQK